MDEQLIRYFQGELDTAERCRLLRQVEASEELKKRFMEYKNIRALVALSGQPGDAAANERDYTRFARLIRRRKIRSVVWHIAAYAAAVALLVGFTYGVTLHYFVSRHTTPVAGNTLYVLAGQRIRLTLSDGTEVWLNSQTRFTYPAWFADKERRVSVEGEAFFDVAENPEQPFIISS
ncbi:MAG: FecR family protein [Parabacteroides sp.]|nr:FecR family protein [Parabacteroides sp.]